MTRWRSPRPVLDAVDFAVDGVVVGEHAIVRECEYAGIGAGANLVNNGIDDAVEVKGHHAALAVQLLLGHKAGKHRSVPGLLVTVRSLCQSHGASGSMLAVMARTGCVGCGRR